MTERGELIHSLKEEQSFLSFLLIIVLVSESESSMPWIFLFLLAVWYLKVRAEMGERCCGRKALFCLKSSFLLQAQISTPPSVLSSPVLSVVIFFLPVITVDPSAGARVHTHSSVCVCGLEVYCKNKKSLQRKNRLWELLWENEFVLSYAGEMDITAVWSRVSSRSLPKGRYSEAVQSHRGCALPLSTFSLFVQESLLCASFPDPAKVFKALT